MLFMEIERFKNRDARAVYSRFREQGRMLPDGLKYVDSWVEANFDRCFQLMECDDPRSLRLMKRFLESIPIDKMVTHKFKIEDYERAVKTGISMESLEVCDYTLRHSGISSWHMQSLKLAAAATS